MSISSREKQCYWIKNFRKFFKNLILLIGFMEDNTFVKGDLEKQLNQLQERLSFVVNTLF